MWKNKTLGYKIKEFQSQSRGDSIHITELSELLTQTGPMSAAYTPS